MNDFNYMDAHGLSCAVKAIVILALLAGIILQFIYLANKLSRDAIVIIGIMSACLFVITYILVRIIQNKE